MESIILLIIFDFYDEIKESFICSSMHVFQQNHCPKTIVTFNHPNMMRTYDKI